MDAALGAPSSAANALSAAAVELDVKAQQFAHRVVEFADLDACAKFFDEKQIDFDRPNASGSTVLMSVVARERVDLIGLVMDRTMNVESATIPNGTTVLHLAAMATNPQVIRELAGTDERKAKLCAIANACNRNGDTPLMMASVAKNAAAAKILVEYLDAFASPKNATGMTALMCASRLRDEREGPTMAAESASIVSLLLAYGADVNAAETTGRQTALHFALLSMNIMVVEQLLTISDINLTARNKAGHSSVELARKFKLDSLIDAAVESQWQVVEEEAQSLSEQVAQELGSAKDATDGAKQLKKGKDKKKKMLNKSIKTEILDKASVVLAVPQKEEGEDEQEQVVESEADAGAAGVPPLNEEPDLAAETDEWVTAAKKKFKRKESTPSEPVPSVAAKNSAASKRNHKAKQSSKSNPPAKPTSSAAPRPVVANRRSEAPSKPATKHHSVLPIKPTAAAIPPPQSKPAPWANGTSRPDVASASSVPPAPQSTPARRATPAMHTLEVEDTDTPGDESLSHEGLNDIFHRMFPIADEMDIPVESFLAGADTRDARELLDGLSVSQVEMLQEAHLQAYHYLNERKIELARVLEGQRLQAQLEIRRQLYQMP